MTARRKASPRRLIDPSATRFGGDGSWMFRIPLHTDSELTQSRKHWRTLKRGVDRAHLIVTSFMQPNRGHLLLLGVTHVRMTRIAPNKMDSDNLHGSLKAVRDTIAEILGRDDADWKTGAIQWEVDQRSEAPRTHGVEIRLWNCNAVSSNSSTQPPEPPPNS